MDKIKTPEEIIDSNKNHDGTDYYYKSEIIPMIEQYHAQFKPQEPSLPKALEELLDEKYPIVNISFYYSNIAKINTSPSDYGDYVESQKHKRSIATQFYLVGVASKEPKDKIYTRQDIVDKLKLFNKHTLQLQKHKIANSYVFDSWIENNL